MKVVIFGDSYANNERAYGESEDKIPWSWSNAIEQKYDVLNYAYPGSSENYTRNKVYEYLDSNNYSQMDTIVFFPTSIWRFPYLNHFELTSVQAIYSSISMEFEAGYTKEQLEHNPDYIKIKDNPEWYTNLHEILTNDSEYLYQQRLMFALLLKNLPNKVIYYDTFFTQHHRIIPGFISRDFDMGIFNNFENFILRDSDSFIFQKSKLAQRCGKVEGYKTTINWKIHNHMNYDQNKLFLQQMCNTIDTFENCFDEQSIVDMLYDLKTLKETK